MLAVLSVPTLRVGIVDEPVSVRLVPVALPKNVFPESVDDAAYKPPNAFKSDEMVVDPVTAREVDVAPCAESPCSVVNPATASVELTLVAPALNAPLTVVEPLIASAVPVALAKKIL